MEAARSLALETGVASVTLTAVARRAGIHYSAVRRYFTSHKEVLLHLSAEGWVRWSNTVSDKLAQPGAATPSRIAETLADALADDPLFCDLLANLHLHLEHEVDAERVVEVKRISTAATLSLADSIQRALPELGRSGSLDILLAAYSLAATLWQVANPPGTAHRRLRRGAGSRSAGMESGLRLRADPAVDRHVHRPHPAIGMIAERGARP
ncbi:Bacterial regulatory protein, tetR family [Mycobacterium avium subsp. paratuberculosis]|nr:Bacterial regulatory protein, tetR family [Mycobacterium avium subsp. paratuberculosis]OVF03375.1 Bacterial regulatory protein, tetR family [Mycobacterium avium subsp. paratuberculosis]